MFRSDNLHVAGLCRSLRGRARERCSREKLQRKEYMAETLSAVAKDEHGITVLIVLSCLVTCLRFAGCALLHQGQDRIMGIPAIIRLDSGILDLQESVRPLVRLCR